MSMFGMGNLIGSVMQQISGQISGQIGGVIGGVLTGNSVTGALGSAAANDLLRRLQGTQNIPQGGISLDVMNQWLAQNGLNRRF